MSRGTIVVGIACAAVAGAVIAGLWISGSPSEARLRRFDQRRADDLANAVLYVNIYWDGSASLPPSLDYAMRHGSVAAPVDPATRQPYEYRVTGPRTFELCAVFDRAFADERRDPRDGSWSHEPGRQCFSREARKP